MKKIYLIVFFFTFSTVLISTQVFALAKTSTVLSYNGEEEFNGDSSRISSSAINLSIYPNPVKTNATISFAVPVDKVVIMNIVGHEVKTFSPEPGSTEIKVNLSELQPGVYFLAAYSKGATLITKRFLKED